MPGKRHGGLEVYAAVVACSAYTGAVGLATGWLDTGPTVESRMPFASPMVGAVALALIVAVPSTAVTPVTRGDARVGPAAVLAGALLVAWIVVELAFIRELSWLQPFYVAVGASLVVIGRHRVTRKRDSRHRRVPSEGLDSS